MSVKFRWQNHSKTILFISFHLSLIQEHFKLSFLFGVKIFSFFSKSNVNELQVAGRRVYYENVISRVTTVLLQLFRKYDEVIFQH